jgi:hypothetical protein
MILQYVLWILACVIAAAALSVAIVAVRVSRPQFALLAAVPIVIGLAGVAFGLVIPAPDRALAVILDILLAGIGIVAGNPITTAVLAYAGRSSGRSITVGQHGGIIIDDGMHTDQKAEVLRGGTIIGHLERLALVAAILLGRLEIVAVLVAVKGLGRFTELDSPEVRERFIIGTLVSLIWAGACALLIVA